MKTLFGCLVLLVLLAALPAKAGVSYLQSSSVKCGTATSCSSAFKNAVVAGDLIVVAGTWDSSRAVISVSDTQGNTYHPAGSAIAIVGGLQNAQIWYAANTHAGATSVTVVLSGAPLFNDIYIHEYSGVDPTNPLDAVSAYTGNGTSLATPDAMVSTDALIFGFGPVENGIPSPGSGFSARQTTDDNLTEDKIAGDAGLYSATMLNSLPVNWVCIMAAFNAAGARRHEPGRIAERKVHVEYRKRRDRHGELVPGNADRRREAWAMAIGKQRFGEFFRDAPGLGSLPV